MKKHITIRVSGRVQGVFYRQSTKNKADQLELAGLVRNDPDGSVYIEAEGAPDTLELFKEWCRQGPPLASVHRIETSEGTLKHFDEFSIQR